MDTSKNDNLEFLEDQRSRVLEDDQGAAGLEPREPNEVFRSSLRHLSPSGLLLLLPHRSVGGATPVLSTLSRRNLGTYFPEGASEAAAAAGAAATGSSGRARGSEGLRAGSAGLPNNNSLLCLSAFSSSSLSLFLCFSVCSANFARRSFSSAFRLSASGV